MTTDAGQIAREHARLIAGADPASVIAAAKQLASRSSGGELLLAQAEYRMGQPALGRRLQDLVARERGCVGGWLLRGAVHEEQGEMVEAALAYQEARSLPVAAARLLAVREPAGEQLARRTREELQRGHTDSAEDWLSKLKALDGGARRTLLTEVEVARALVDSPRELTALRLLAPAPSDFVLGERWAQLEMLCGIPAEAVHVAEELVRDAPAEGRRKDLLEEMRFRYRLTLLPAPVRSALEQPVLERGDLAALLYWLAPGVRQTRASARDIASDVVGHRWREEIVRCVNLDLLPLDSAMRLFYPARAATRAEALAALAKAQRWSANESCAAPRAASVASEPWCDFALRCALLDSVEECLAGVPVAGQEVATWMRRLAASTAKAPAGRR